MSEYQHQNMNKKILAQFLILTFSQISVISGAMIIFAQIGLTLNNHILMNFPFMLYVLSPSMASYIVLKKNGKVGSFGEWLKNIFKVKSKIVHYLYVILGVALFYVLRSVVSGLKEMKPIYMLFLLLPVMLIGGGMEEAGWRYILQPELNKKFGFVVSCTLTGLIWYLWHLPLFLIPGTYQHDVYNLWMYAPFILGIAFFLGAIQKISSNVFLCVLFHTLINAGLEIFISPFTWSGTIVTAIAMVLISIITVEIHKIRIKVDARVCEADALHIETSLYHTDNLPDPEWDAQNLYKPEPMSAFFNTRADEYNAVMFTSSSGEEDYKKLGACFPKTDEAIQMLNVGCGTGIELDYIWARIPNAHIVCVDVSRGMLNLLLKNHPDSHERITIVEASYIDWLYPDNAFDFVVSNMTMHHLWPEEKVEVYQKIHNTLKPGGVYIEGDFTVKDELMVKQYKRRYEIITANLPDKAKASEYHIDIPCTLEVQIKLLHDAGFSSIEIIDDSINRGNGAILKARK